MQRHQLRRREFITLLGGGAAAAWPLAARAQQPGRIYRLGILTGLKRDSPVMIAFFEELGRLGFVEGQNLSVVPDGFEVRHDEFTERATEIIKAAPDVIFTPGPTPTRAAQIATRTLPIVGGSGDMLADELVASLARPDGNTTGISMISPELDGKRQDILIEAVPGVPNRCPRRPQYAPDQYSRAPGHGPGAWRRAFAFLRRYARADRARD
jgi:putative tryptophan/tyrosine transport system substrate-binding protein